MKNFKNIFVLSLCGLAAACSSKEPAPAGAPVVQKVAVSDNSPKPGVNGPSQSVNVIAVVDKRALLGQEFLYGADLQYSNYHDPGFNLYNQSMAIGHIPVTFRIAGDELQLVADNRRLSASDVNHPELLISRFRILSQTDSTLTISGADSSVFLAEVFEGTKNSGDDALFNPAGAPPRDKWIRSFEYVAKGSYVLQQSSIITADGSVAEFAESIFPRSTLTPGANFQKFVMDPNSPQGMNDDFFIRFRFLPGETVFDASAGLSPSGDPLSVAYASHYDISPKADGTPGTIDWYVTANAPDETLPALKEAVEGWNRYFREEKGIQRDVVQFKGRLPDGIHIGDPRFNVINWDKERVAGAAYETQATDPFSGKQSHSLIYMPAAWLQIGLDYYKSGITADLESRDVLSARVGKSSARASATRFGCLRDMRDSFAPIASGRLNRDDVKKYAIELLKQTLFHEVGHSLGLAHNFKGSLSYNVTDPKSMFSTSIMDYNDYEIERAAFYDVNSTDGPLLEYDRQAISAIYNQHKDVSGEDPNVPVCNDAEADTEDSGIDPLCIRYDIENDPTHSIVTALNRINEATLPSDTTLSVALSRVPDLALASDAIQAARTEDDVKALTRQLGKGLTGALTFYLASGKASLAKVVKTNVKSLLEFEDSVLPDGYSEADMRARAFDGVQKTVAFTDLPAPVKTALNAAEKAGLEEIAKAPFFGSLISKDQELAKLRKSLDAAVMAFAQGESSNLATMRAAVLTVLARHPKVSFFFGPLAGKNLDFEKDLIGILSNTLAQDSKATHVEQVAAAKSLMSYNGRLYGAPAISQAVKDLTQKRLLAKDVQDRDNAEELLAIVSK